MATPVAEEAQQGGELVDLGTFVGDPPEHIDPALNTTLDAYQVVNALYDGLTEIDATDPENPEIVAQVAESFEANDDATVWTFTISEGLAFSDGEEILPSSFVRAWERASDPDFAGDYSYLFNFIEGGAEKLDGAAETISGVEADDDAMTLTVTLSAPYSNFDAVAGFQLFLPDAPGRRHRRDQDGLGERPDDRQRAVHAGGAAHQTRRSCSCRNHEWDGTVHRPRHARAADLDKLTFRVSADPDTAYNAFEAGEGDTAQHPAGPRAARPTRTTPTRSTCRSSARTTSTSTGRPGGRRRGQPAAPPGDLARPSTARRSTTAVYEGSRTISTGSRPRASRASRPTSATYCAYDAEAAQAAVRRVAGRGQRARPSRIKIQFNTGAGHEDVVEIIIDNLSPIGIEAEAERSTPRRTSRSWPTVRAFCRAGWFADYPTYDNFMYDLFHSDVARRQQPRPYSNPEFDALVDEAKADGRPEEQAELFHQAETILLNEDIGVIPINWYRGDYVYNEDQIGELHRRPTSGSSSGRTCSVKQG